MFSSGSTTFGGSAVAQKYNIHQSALFEKKKFKNCLLRGPRENVFPGPVVAQLPIESTV